MRGDRQTASEYSHRMSSLGRMISAWVMLSLGLGSAQASNGVTRDELLAACNGEAHFKLLEAHAEQTSAKAAWLDARHILWPGAPEAARYQLQAVGAIDVGVAPTGSVSAPVRSTRSETRVDLAVQGPFKDAPGGRFAWLGAGLRLALPEIAPTADLLRDRLILVALDADGKPVARTRVQVAGALDALYAAAAEPLGFGPLWSATARSAKGAYASLRLWAPTARNVSLCLYPDAQKPASELLPMKWEPASGSWFAAPARAVAGRTYTFLVEVEVPGVGRVLNRVTDPYSVSLTADSRRSVLLDLNAPGLKPSGWDGGKRTPALERVRNATDMVIYELHVRDFSISDASVPAALRGKYGAFTQMQTAGMKHLAALSQAGLTDVHLLPVFDIASIPERGCKPGPSPQKRAAADNVALQKAALEAAAGDCFNWGYDPFHFNAPEGSYASNAEDGAVRVREFRSMVQALNRVGLRVGMDVVYNHTNSSGQDARSVLDRIVPGYYHRLDAEGKVTRSTCCENTATEHRMMAKLMIDSVVLWATQYRIDSFRFDLMGHQPREAMERLQKQVNAAVGRPVQLIGEGWNFGEVENGARFVQASQLSLPGSGIATFSDRARDGARGGGHGDSGEAMVLRQGWLNGLGDAPNALVQTKGDTARRRAELLQSADLLRVGLAGSIAGIRITDHSGQSKRLEEIRYANQPAGYVREPGEVVNYVENHDNHTLWDLNALKLPATVSARDRAHVQMLGAALVAFSQGIAYFHAGQDILRSKSLDGNSFDSGDVFNRLDFSYRDNGFGIGLPPARDNEANWAVSRAALGIPSARPSPEDIAFARDHFRDLLKIRASTPLFRLSSAAEIEQRLSFPNSGADQNPLVLVGHLDGEAGGALPGNSFKAVLYAINTGSSAQTVAVGKLKGRGWQLHPVHRAPKAADQMPAKEARLDEVAGTVTVPSRTAVVWVR